MTSPALMTCREANEFLFDYISGELAWNLREHFEAHISGCQPCLSYLVQYRDTIRLGRVALEEWESGPPQELIRAILSVRQRAS